jgi:hypothetical protein
MQKRADEGKNQLREKYVEKLAHETFIERKWNFGCLTNSPQHAHPTVETLAK